jgi:assimilatory nitrate reductase catalytic subunit
VRDAHYPVSLTTGRWRDQWHGMSRTGTLGRLQSHAGESVIEMHPQDLKRHRVQAGDLVRVKSRRGEIVLPVVATTTVAPAQAFIAMHGDKVNRLTTSANCPQSRQPELKHAAVRVQKADLPWHLAATAWLPADEVLSRQQDLQARLSGCSFAQVGLVGREPEGPLGVSLYAAHTTAVADIEWIADVLGLGGDAMLRYDDTQRGLQRRVRIGSDGRLQAFLLVGDAAAARWMRDWLLAGRPATGQARMLLSGLAQPPQGVPVASPQVCTCHDVRESAIRACLREPDLAGGDGAQRLARVQVRLGCGTSCGSCLPAVKALLQSTRETVT